MSSHPNSPIGNNHIIENWSYADAAARAAATGFAAGDVGKIAYQRDEGSYWRLTAVTPTWVSIGGGGAATHEVNDAATNTPTTAVTISHNSSGTVAAGFGVDFTFAAETSTTEDTEMGRLEMTWAVVTHASRVPRFAIHMTGPSGEMEMAAMLLHNGEAVVDRNDIGAGAVDFQTNRSAGTMVASGYYAGLFAGVHNTASGSYSGVFAGTANVASGYGAGVLAGYGNTVSGYYGGALSGSSNTVAHQEAASLAGKQASTRWQGQLVNANGRFSADGDAQGTVQAVLRRAVTHSDSSWSELFLTGSSGRLAIPTDTLMTFHVLIAGATSGLAKSFSFIIEGAIKNDGGTTTLLNSTVTTVYDTDDTSFDARVSADDTNDALLIEVSDADSGGDTVNWVAKISTVEIIYA